MKSKEELKSLFENGDIPKQEDFWEWQDSYWHKNEKLPPENIDYDFSRKADLIDGKIPATQLPSYVDDVLEFGSLEVLPNPGERGKIYVITSTNTQLRWSGSEYIPIISGENVMITDSPQNVFPNGTKTFWTDENNNSLHIKNTNSEGAGITFDSNGVGQIIYNDDQFRFTNNSGIDSIPIVSDGFIKSDSSDDYLLTGGGDHKAISDFVLSDQLGDYISNTSWNNITGKKWFKTDGGNTWDNNAARIQGINGYNAGLTFYRDGIDVGQIIFDGYSFNIANSDNTGYFAIKSAGFIKNGFDDNYLLLAGGQAKPVSDFALSDQLGNYHNIDLTDGINNGSDSHTNKTWFDYNWAGQYKAGSVINFSGHPFNSFSTELFADYLTGDYIGVRTHNKNADLWNPVKWLWHTGNFNPDTKVNKSGDTMTGNLTVPNLVLSSNKLLSQVLNGGQILHASNDTMYIGNSSGLDYLNLESKYSLTHYQNGVPGAIWTAHNFNPSSKVDALENATGVGFSAGNIPTNTGSEYPYMRYVDGSLIALATQGWVNNTFVTKVQLNDYYTATQVNNLFISNSQKGVANGVATLDSTGLIPSSQLPSYVDDVLEFDNLASFPATGESGKIYIAIDTNKTYRWSGSSYIYITSGAVDMVNGLTGVVVLNKSHVGLNNVDNTADAAKNVLSATKWTTAQNITLSGVTATAQTIDGSGSVTIPVTAVPATLLTGTAAINTTGSAAKLTTPRTISATGDASWTTTFDGSTNVTSALTLAATGVTAGTFDRVTVDSKGRVLSGSNVNYVISDITGLQTALDNKENAFSKNSAFNKNFGNSSGTVAEGNDPRILNGQEAYNWGDWHNAGFLVDDGNFPKLEKYNQISSSPYYVNDTDNKYVSFIFNDTANGSIYFDEWYFLQHFEVINLSSSNVVNLYYFDTNYSTYILFDTVESRKKSNYKSWEGHRGHLLRTFPSVSMVI